MRAALCLLLVACSGGAVRIEPYFPHRAALSIPADVAFLRITVRGEGMAEITHQEALADSGVIEVPGVPPGLRTVVLEGLDAAEQVSYFGKGSVDVVARGSNTLAVMMQPAFPNARVGLPLSVASAKVGVDLTVTDAVSVTIANDQTFALNRQTFTLAQLQQTNGSYVVKDWDLNGGLGDSADGPRLVYARFTNADGVLSRVYSAQTRLDSLAPVLTADALVERCDDWPASRIAQNAVWVPLSTRLECTKAGFDKGPIRVSFAINEKRGVSSVYVASSGQKLPLQVDEDASTDAFVVAYYTPNDTEIASAPNLFATLSDGAGNTADVPLGELRFDHVSPVPPSVNDAQCVVYNRRPWGALNDPLAKASIGSGTECVTPPLAADVVAVAVYDAPLSGAKVLGIAPKNAEGFITYTELSGGDRQDLFASARDAAGNGSPSVRVRDVWWHATMGGKVVGTNSNPNRFLTSPRFISNVPTAASTEATLPTTTTIAPRWSPRSLTITPPSEFGFQTMTWDSHRGRIVHSTSGPAGPQTFSFDGFAWQQVCGGTSTCVDPSGGYASVAYNDRSGEVYLARAIPGDGSATRLWAFDGTWRVVCGAGTSCAMPPILNNVALAYDPFRDVLLMVAENMSAEFDGVAWSTIGEGVGHPKQNSNFASPAAYHRARGIFLVTAMNSTNTQRFNWELSGSTWTSRPTGEAPPMDALAYDQQRDVMVGIVGVDPDDTSRTAVWELAAAGSWSKKCGAGTGCASTFARTNTHLSYNGVQGNIMMVGGKDPNTSAQINDQWAWLGTAWRRVCNAASCIGPDDTLNAAAYDPVTQATVAFGGYRSPGPDSSDTWSFDGWSWSQCNNSTTCATRPTERHGHGMTAVTTGVILFGGQSNSGTLSNQTWLWNGAWSQLCGSGTGCSQTPSARDRFGLTTNTLLNRVMLFGGSMNAAADDNYSDQLWERGASGWVQLCGTGTACSGPPELAGAALGYDEERNVTVMFGGTTENDGSVEHNDDVWEWNGAWTKIDACVTAGCHPGTDTNPGKFVFDPISRELLWVGLRDTWSWDGLLWHQLCGRDACSQAMIGDPSSMYDPHVGGIFIQGGGGEVRNAVFDRGGGSFPMQVFEANLGSAGPPDTSRCSQSPETCPLQWLTLDWQASASSGTTLIAWTKGQWVDTGETHAITVTDPQALGDLVVTRGQKIYFGMLPVTAADPLTTTDVELTLAYRLPAQP